MKLEAFTCSETGDRIYKLSISSIDLVRTKFYSFDHMLFEECEKSESVADKLLALETIARRVEKAK